MPNLPQNVSPAEQAARKNRIVKNCSDYKWDQDSLKPLSLLLNVKPLFVPPGEVFDARYVLERGAQAVAPIAANALEVKFRTIWDPFDAVDDYADLFQALPEPNITDRYRTDRAFAEQRISGVNPLVLSRCDDISMLITLGFTDAHIAAALGPAHTITSAVGNQLLYLADYQKLDFVQGGSFEGRKKYLAAPIALFAKRDLGVAPQGTPRIEFAPVAIIKRLGQAAVTPDSPQMEWFVAKLAVQVADANFHEMSSHLCRTHFVMEPFAVALARTVDVTHPVSVLLQPHFRFLLMNNYLGKKHLIAQGGAVERLLAGTLNESLELVKNSYTDWGFDKHAFKKDIADRGLDDNRMFPHYPFRDDGLLVWAALEKFVKAYVAVYYLTDVDVQNDTELQDYARELTAPTGGNLKSKGVPDKFDTVSEVVDFLTNLIFINGPLHSAVNFPQYEYMSFCPNMPLASFRDLTGNLSGEKDLLDALPPFGHATGQLDTIAFLSLYRYDQLGEYSQDHFTDQKVTSVLDQFRQDLLDAEREIARRNTLRPVAYVGLLPSQIINSISV